MAARCRKQWLCSEMLAGGRQMMNQRVEPASLRPVPSEIRRGRRALEGWAIRCPPPSRASARRFPSPNPEAESEVVRPAPPSAHSHNVRSSLSASWHPSAALEDITDNESGTNHPRPIASLAQEEYAVATLYSLVAYIPSQNGVSTRLSVSHRRLEGAGRGPRRVPGEQVYRPF